ncbi:hypothetical protein HYD_6150 [Candidatus Hydrogenosomobacter endosymbioticus]|uniref:Uncharacterized protein n=2 Tax=Candidatus Hydrogenosomobacter endosymbioticus TaxID=2558174 RepID=A0ABM7V9K4_9PROT|nr:hypothetical protein HYD_6150 [Candidatus Hydrogenosomobacter endosymbioticus]
MEKEQAASIDGLIQALREEGFDFEKDRIFSSYLGGIVSASGAKSLGCVFQIPVANIRDLERYDILNCMFLDLEAGKDIKNVYVLLSEKQKLSPRIVEHFLKMVRKDQEIKRIYIGEGPENIFSDRGSRLFLVGPYSFNKEFVPDKRIVEQYMKLYGI